MKKKKLQRPSPNKRHQQSAETASSNDTFFVVGLGASAGGLEALERFFSSMPEDSGMAFVVVSHLDPHHISIMPELLQKYTRMKVIQAADGMRVEPNHVYVAPPNSDLAMLHGTLQLIEPLEAHGFRLPINHFFKSLAADLGERAICIILSGMASDGTAGLQAVKSELGIGIVQEPQSARFDGMPTSAIKTGLADYILPPEEMPAQLIKYISQKIKGVPFKKAMGDGNMPDALQKLFILLRTHTGHDFSLYKPNTIYRRVERRMNVSQFDNLQNYTRFLQENPAEIDSLFKELLVGVTCFFRDPEAFENLKQILIELIKSKPESGQLRIWVPGCSTGEEAYSVAMLARECLVDARRNLYVQVFGTDIDSKAIDKARRGCYSGIQTDVGRDRLSRFFTVEGDGFCVRKDIRETLVFAPQSVIKDPPFTKLDLIVCRNLLIYFSSDLQKKILPMFHYSLLPNGILFLGSSESIHEFVDLFTLVDPKWKIYRKKDSLGLARSAVAFPISWPTGQPRELFPRKPNVPNVAQYAQTIILQSYAPVCVIVAEDGDIVYIHGRTGKYLELTHGQANINIFALAREGLKHELPALVRKAASNRKPAVVEGIKVKSNGRAHEVNVTVKPITEPKEMSGHMLVIFEEPRPQRKPAKVAAARLDKKPVKIIKGLERELKSTKENLRSTIEALETSNEELKSTNEEIQSINEEMQSANEELETSKEELQSLNEELMTVNTELQHTNDELSVINNDMKNLLDSIDIPTIFLDSRLCITKFTFHATKVMDLIDSDIGRPINHLTAKFSYDRLLEDAREVLRTLERKEVDLQTRDGVWYHMRMLPYRTISNAIDGVVITFSDIDKLKTTQEEITALNRGLQLAREYAENIIDTVRESLLILDEDLKVVSANRSFFKMFNTTSDNTVGRYLYDLDNKKWAIPELRELLEQIIPRKNYIEDFEIEYPFENGESKTLLLNARQMIQGGRENKLILLAIQPPVR